MNGETIKNCVSKAARKWNCHKRNRRNEERKKWTRTRILHEKIVSAWHKIIYFHSCLSGKTMMLWLCSQVNLSKMKIVFVFLLLISLFTVSRFTAIEIKRTKTHDQSTITNHELFLYRKVLKIQIQIFPMESFHLGYLNITIEWWCLLVLRSLFVSLLLFWWFFYIFLDPFPTDWA